MFTWCAARLLERAGPRVAIHDSGRAKLPAILLGSATQKLLADVFGECAWLRSLPRIEKRIVAWGGAPVTVPHFAVVVSEAVLAEHLRPRMPEPASPEWTLYGSRPLPAGSIDHAFGTRRAAAVPVELQPSADRTACWIEALKHGWLFLIPGWLLAVGDTPEALLAESRLVAPQIGASGAPAGEFPAHPRIADPLCGPGWLAGGAAALSFDPLCGDGTGHAIREGILAAAVIRAAPAEGLLTHYRARLVAGFKRHLQVCEQYYKGGRGLWWQQELAMLRQGIAWCGDEPEFRFRLEGFDLIPTSPSDARSGPATADV